MMLPYQYAEPAIGEGCYGFPTLPRKVYRAKHVHTGSIVALKIIKRKKNEGCPQSAILEAKILQRYRHPNIIDFYGMHMDGKNYVMALKLMDFDLSYIIHETQLTLSSANIKYFLQQLLQGLNFLHKRDILHLDIKTNNILLDRWCDLKICDFGISSVLSSSNKKPNQQNSDVITLWYRPLELLFSSHNYSTEVDMWSVGCVFGEMVTREIMFRGQDIPEQVQCIFNICGTPHYHNYFEKKSSATCLWYDADKLEHYYLFQDVHKKEIAPTILEKFCNSMSLSGLYLLDQLCCLDPQKRISAHEALEHDYFVQELPAAEKMYLVM